MKLDAIFKEIDTFFDHRKIIGATDVPFADDVRKMCEQNTCGNYGKSWTCPPAVGSTRDLQSQLSAFDQFIIIDKVYSLEDSFDWEGMMESAKDFQTRIRRLRKGIRTLAGDFKFHILGAGTCIVCPTCAYLTNEPCRNPDEAVYSVEACGIDVMNMMSKNGMKYNHGQSTVTYIGGIFYTETP